jgi:hypothetical protein
VPEWLEHHATSELLVVDDPRAEPLAPPLLVAAGAHPRLGKSGRCRIRGLHWRRHRPRRSWASTAGGGVSGWERAAAPAMGARGPGGAQSGWFINLLGTEWLPAIPTAPVRPTRVRPGLAKPSPAVLRSGCFAAYACASRAHPVEVQPCLSGKSARRVSAALTQRTRWRTLVSPQGTTPFGGQPPAATRSSSERFNLARQAGRLPGRGAGCCGRWGTEPDAAAGVH